MSELLRKIDSIALLRGVRYKEPLNSLCNFLKLRENGGGATIEQLIESYSTFVSVLYNLRVDADLSAAIWDALADDMNPLIKNRIDGIIAPDETREMSTLIKLTGERELNLLTEIGSYTSTKFKDGMYYDGYLADFRSSKIDFRERYMKMLEELPRKGYGIYSKYLMFKIDKGEVVPVKHPDPIREEELFCYDRQRNLVIDNTRAFLNGKPAADILLYGDAGTGKSSTVKAVARKFGNEGIRLVELPKSEIGGLSYVIEKLSMVPMKFILFIDDISFDANDERIGSLKSILEGAASGDRRNIIIYCTSNRRHIIKETFSDRNDEVHSSDTIAEQMSLSERFGLRILFDKPNKATYIEIVKMLCKLRGITEKTDEELELGAEQYALRNGGRSARLARQYVDYLET